LAFKLSASLGGNLGVGGAIGGVGVSAAATASTGKNYTAALTQSEQKVLASMSHDDLSEFKRFSDRLSRDTSVLQAIGTDEQRGSELASRFASATGRVERADRALMERVAIAERVSASHESGDTLSVDLSRSPDRAYLMQRYTELADRYGDESSAVQIMLSNELALRSLRPTGSFSDGSAMPSSFESLRGQYEASKQDPQMLQKEVDSAAANNERRLGSRSGTPRPLQAAPASAADGVRAGIEGESKPVSSTVHREIEQFDKRNEIVRDKDGTVHTSKSQFRQNLNDLASDAGSLLGGDKDEPKK
jgi:conjugal transfer mating pair stabilization protein TraG